MPLSKEFIASALESYHTLNEAIENLATEIGLFRKARMDRWNDFESFEIEYPEGVDRNISNVGDITHATIHATFDASFRGDCGFDVVSFPASYLWEENWQSQETEALAAKKEKEEAARQEAAKVKEERDHALYLKLKERFDG